MFLFGAEILRTASEDTGLINRVIKFHLAQRTWPQSTNVTDGQTDRQTSYDGMTAPLIAWSGKKHHSRMYVRRTSDLQTDTRKMDTIHHLLEWTRGINEAVRLTQTRNGENVFIKLPIPQRRMALWPNAYKARSNGLIFYTAFNASAGKKVGY